MRVKILPLNLALIFLFLILLSFLLWKDSRISVFAANHETSAQEAQPFCLLGQRLCFSSPIEIFRRGGGGGGGGGGPMPPGGPPGGGPPSIQRPTPTPKPPPCPQGLRGAWTRSSLKLSCFMPRPLVNFIENLKTLFVKEEEFFPPLTSEDLLVGQNDFSFFLNLNYGLPKKILLPANKAYEVNLQTPQEVEAKEVFLSLDCNPSRLQPAGVHQRIALKRLSENQFWTGNLEPYLDIRVERLRCSLKVELSKEEGVKAQQETVLDLVP